MVNRSRPIQTRFKETTLIFGQNQITNISSCLKGRGGGAKKAEKITKAGNFQSKGSVRIK